MGHNGLNDLAGGKVTKRNSDINQGQRKIYFVYSPPVQAAKEMLVYLG
jgi:hypothetical protein